MGVLQRGDLLFFDLDRIDDTGPYVRETPSEVTHVGLYDHDNLMVNAMSPTLNIGYGHLDGWDWSKRFLFARRIPSIVSSQPPIIDPGGPYVGAVGGRVTLDASGSSDPDGDSATLTFLWRFDDDVTETGARVSHVFAVPGTHVVSLTVRDVTGAESTTTVSVLVLPTAGLTVTPASVSFGTVVVGTCISPIEVLVQHASGTAGVTGTVTAGPTPPFRISEGGSFNVANGALARARVEFCPTALGAVSGSAVVTAEGASFANGNTVTLTGVGIAPPSIAGFGPTTNISRSATTSVESQLAAQGQSVYAVWQEGVLDTRAEIWYRRSLDGGETWSPGLDAQATSLSIGSQEDRTAVLPRVAVSGTTVLVAWIETRGAFDTRESRLMVRRSVDAGASFAPAQEIVSSRGLHTVEDGVFGLYVRGSDAYLLYPDAPAPNTDLLVLQRSRDGGATWGGRVLVAQDSGCRRAASFATSDELVAIFFSCTGIFASSFGTDVFLARSLDGGDSFDLPIDVSAEYASTGIRAGTPALATGGSSIYTTWARVADFGVPPETPAFRGSRDGGVTWDRSLEVPAVGLGQSGIGGFPAIAASESNVYVAWAVGDSIVVRRSVDGGATWDPDLAEPPRAVLRLIGASSGPAPRVVALGANVYLLGHSFLGGVVLTRSSDNGRNWEPVRRIEGTVLGSGVGARLSIVGTSVYTLWEDGSPQDVFARSASDLPDVLFGIPGDAIAGSQGVGPGSNKVLLGQVVSASDVVAGTILGIRISLGRNGNPSDDLVVALRAEIDGPDITRAVISGSSLTNQNQLMDVMFDTPATTSSVRYVVLYRTGAPDAANFATVGHELGNPYPGGGYFECDAASVCGPRGGELYDLTLALLGRRLPSGTISE
jgi:PKD repeat protein